jgi:hypothetical protein
MTTERKIRPAYAMRLPYTNFNGLRIIGRDTATIAVVEQWAADQGHADFIVTACNAHDQLVAENAVLREQLDRKDAVANATVDVALMMPDPVREQLVAALQGLLVAINSSHPDAADMVGEAERVAQSALAAAGVTP